MLMLHGLVRCPRYLRSGEVYWSSEQRLVSVHGPSRTQNPQDVSLVTRLLHVPARLRKFAPSITDMSIPLSIFNDESPSAETPAKASIG
jgi:hypothetical protein